MSAENASSLFGRQSSWLIITTLRSTTWLEGKASKKSDTSPGRNPEWRVRFQFPLHKPHFTQIFKNPYCNLEKKLYNKIKPKREDLFMYRIAVPILQCNFERANRERIAHELKRLDADRVFKAESGYRTLASRDDILCIQRNAEDNQDVQLV